MGGTGINVVLHNNTINTYEYRVKSYLTFFSLNLPWIYRRQNFATNFIFAFLPPLIPGLIKSPRQPPPFNCQLLIKDFGVWTSLPIGSTQSDQRGCPCYHHLQGGFFNWSAQKMTKCQTLRKFWHLELFWRNLHVIWHLVIFRADQLKKPPCIIVYLKYISLRIKTSSMWLY